MNLHNAIEEASRKIGLCLKDKQVEAIITLCSGQDTFISLPTGYRKSIIFTILPQVYDKISGMIYGCLYHVNTVAVHIGKKGSVIVWISPLNAIIVEQQAKFVAMSISAEYVGEVQKNPMAWMKMVNG